MSIRTLEAVFAPSTSEEDFQSFARQLKGNGLKLWGTVGLFPGSLKVVGPDAHLEEAVEYVRQGMKRAAACGTKVVVFGSGAARRIPAGFDPRIAWRQLVELGKAIAPIAQENGIRIAVEPLNCGDTNTITSVGAALEYIRQVAHPSFRLLVDLFHFQKSDRDLAMLGQIAPHLAHVHVATYENRCFPGMEECDFSVLFHELKRHGYDGAIAIEAAKCDWTPEGVRRALDTLRAAWEAA